MNNDVQVFQNFLRNQKARGANILVPKYQGDVDGADFFEAPDEHEYGNADIVEKDDKKFKIIDVKLNAKESGFSYFLDGIQRKKVIVISNKQAQIPIAYGYVAAAILKRTCKEMHSTDLFMEDKSIYLPYKEFEDSPSHYFEKEVVLELNAKGLNTKNIGVIDKRGKIQGYPVHPAQIESMARSAVETQRADLEKDLTKKWLNQKNNDGWLFVDGRIEPINAVLSEKSQAVGIVKSHKMHYFEYKKEVEIYNMKKSQRTSVFRPIDKQGKPENIYSWYLRLHESKSSGNIDFGIIRVEIPAKDELLDQVDLISNWIMLETKPIAFPASRWDRMIYPIKYCEDYLKSKAPSYTLVESLV